LLLLVLVAELLPLHIAAMQKGRANHAAPLTPPLFVIVGSLDAGDAGEILPACLLLACPLSQFMRFLFVLF
jgi:hypothetical protein